MQKLPTVSLLKRAAPLAALAASVLLAAPMAFSATGLQTAVFAGGCFWTMERDFEHTPGVVKAVSGYDGGTKPRPTYDEVSSETTDYVESVQVTFDPKKISYTQLLDRYWHFIIPTQANGQACDRGASYNPEIFVSTPEQKRIAEAQKAQLNASKFHGKIVVQIRDERRFWPAEAYHQQYARKNPVQYNMYRVGCGRDGDLKRIWGSAPA
ncbi:MAG TPA: peptide-methionine (S)-S-oxide reductase MsrA [Caulobacteraceae bacterium]|jgi:peptide-methionine (S)-S-oxide reductase|nr:peptide-methionine (S)-S-oxide reductase MsrA [Caulobacteraceae bacterium]